MRPGVWSVYAVLAFVATRAVLLFGYGAFVTDMPLYQSAGTDALKGLTAYCDYWFPYPPLSLPFVNIPAMFNQTGEGYRMAFRLEMLVFDVVCFAGVWAFLRDRTAVPEKVRVAALAFYSLLGLAVGHLIYDRLDIVMTSFFIWALYAYTSPRASGRPIAYLLLLAGALFKLLPLFVLPLFMILEAHSDDGRWPNLRRSILPVAWVAVPFAATIILYNQVICDHLIEQLSQHGSRGIQIESNWALPLIGLRIFRDWPVSVDYVYGAFHIVDSVVPKPYLFLSKYAGFAALLGFYAFLVSRFRKSLVDTSRFSAVEILCLFYAVLLLLICTQRVLSPQYLIWLMPAACVQFAVAGRKMAAVAGAGATFALTYVVFDLGFFRILAFHPWYSLALLARNILLLLWAADLLRRILKSLRRQRQAAIAGY